MAFSFGGFGQQNQTPGQQNNQQQQTPAFGGFGAASTFGSTTPATGFGQQQQPQQQTGSLFGGFGGNTTTTPAFGGTTTATNTGGGLFGSQNAAPAAGGFGGGSSGFSFGAQQPATGGGLFGSAAPATTAFGGGGGAFGSAATTGNQANPNDFVNPNPGVPPPSDGTANAPMDPKNPNRVLLWKDNRTGTQTGPDGKQANVNGEQLLFDNITALPMYWHVSSEELRLQDYQQNRKTAPPAGAAGFGSSFGQASAAPAFGAGTTAFGQSAPAAGGLFGARPAAAPAQGTTGGLFGSGSGSTFGKPAGTPAFGASTAGTGATGGGLFGQPAAQPAATSAFGTGGSTFGGFGQNNQQAKPAFSFGGGATAAPAAGGLFGQTNTATPAFGQANPQQPSGFSFGANNNTATGTTGGLFGQANKPAGGGLFGGAAAGTPDNKPSFSFGAPSATTQPSTGLFGQPAQQQNQPGQQPAAGGGLFGNLGQSSTFGQQNTNTGGGLFGNAAAKPATGGLFGNTSTTGAAAPSFSFGGGNQQQQTQPGTTGGGLFGGGNTGGGGLFGNLGNQQQNTQQQAQPQQGGGLFGGGASTFGAGNTGGGGLFGNLGQNQNQGQQQQPASTFSLSAPSFGGFGQSQNNQQNQSLLGQSQQQPLQPLNLSIDQNPYGNNPIFANVQPAKASEGPRAYDADQPKKQLPLHISYRGTPRSSVKINKLRGFATSASSPGLGASRFSSPGTPGTPLHASLGNTLSRPGTASPAQFAPNGLDLSLTLPPQAFPSRPSVKKLIIDKKHRENTDYLFGRNKPSGTATPTGDHTPAQDRALFNPEAETSDRVSAALSRDGSRNTATGKGKAAPTNGSAPEEKKVVQTSTATTSRKPLQEGDYYTKPDFKELQSMSDEELSEVSDFVVGRVGFGEVCWLEPVDLTGLASLRELLGEVVVIEDREVMVYPGDYEDEKPEVGSGLNVPAVISLQNCWPLDRATREPLKDPQHARVKQHIRKLEKKEETEFVDYEVSSGTWTFKVAHFSRYGLDSDDEEAEEDVMANQAGTSTQQRKKVVALSDRARDTKKQRRTDSPVSDSTSGSDDDDQDYDDAPPQATLDDDESMDESYTTERSFSRTPVPRRSLSDDGPEDTFEETETEQEEEPRRRKRSVAAPTPRAPHSSQFTGRNGNNASRTARIEASTPAVEVLQQQPLPQRLGLEPKKLAVMQASFFSKPRKDEQVSESAIISKVARMPVMAPVAIEQSQPMAFTAERQDEYIPQYRPLRQRVAVPLEQSLVKGKEGSVLDAGLTLGRSFRATFGPQGQLITIGQIASISGSSKTPQQTRINILKPTTLTRDLLAERQDATRMLQIQLNHTSFDDETESLPFASTLPDLRFHHFIPSAQDRNIDSEATMYKLGSALFDEIDLELPQSVTPEVAERVSRMRRKDAFSAWLQEAVAPAVERDLRQIAQTAPELREPATIFALLTGYQIERACQAALSAGDLRLSTLLAQAGGDNEFRADIEMQIAKWREYRVDPHINKAYRKVYELLSGNVGDSTGTKGTSKIDSSDSIMISEDLDWKRAFALYFWYADVESSPEQAISRYAKAISHDPRIARPDPMYKVEDLRPTWQLPDDGAVQDILYEMIKLYAEASNSLEDVLTLRASCPSPYAHRRAWHLYQLLARSLHIRDFEDSDTNGYSAKSHTVAESYADELERLSLWQWAAFVLLHLPDSDSREKAIRELLARHVSEFNDEVHTFLTETLAIPARYLQEIEDVYGENGSAEEEGSA